MDDARFLQAIVANPADTTRRLVYADWLEENGQPERAEFIRVQCALANHPSNGAELEKRRAELYRRYAGAWFGVAHRLLGKELTVERGFADTIALSARRFIEHGEAIFQAAPTIEGVLISRLGRNMPELARCTTLQRVRSLMFFETPFRAREATEFARSPHLGNLRELCLDQSESEIGIRGAVALAGAESLTGLEELGLDNQGVYDEGAATLFQSRRLATLTHLNLRENGLTDRAARCLSNAADWELRSLNLWGNHLTNRGVAALADAHHLAGLETLQLNFNPLGLAAAPALAQARFADRLRFLGVYDCQLGDQALAELFGAAFPRLEELHAGGNPLGREAAASLRTNSAFSRLHTLSLSRCGIGPAAAAVLGEARRPALRNLDLRTNPLGAAGVERLFAGPLLSDLRHLQLDGAGLGDAGAEIVAAGSLLAPCRWLHLPDNQITDRGAIALAESPHLGTVEWLVLSNNDIGPKGKAALTHRFGTRVTF